MTDCAGSIDAIQSKTLDKRVSMAGYELTGNLSRESEPEHGSTVIFRICDNMDRVDQGECILVALPTNLIREALDAASSSNAL